VGAVSDDYTRMKDSRCNSADTCTLDTRCPFAGGCHAAETRDDDGLYFGPHPPNDDGFLVPPVVADHFAKWFVIPDTREHKPLPWRWRLKQRIQGARTRLAEIAYRVVAGEWPRDGEDDW
jgi:hypothetical protein